MFRRPIVLAAFVAMGLLGTSAYADLIIAVQEDGEAPQTFTLAGSPTGDLVLGPGLGSPSMPTSITTTDYVISVQAGEADQTSSLTELLSSAVSVTNTTGVSGQTLNISIIGTGYTSPTTPPNVVALSNLGNTVVKGSAGDLLSLTSSVIPADFVSPFTPQTNSFSAAGSFSNSQTQTITSLPSVGSSFSMTQVLTITLNSLDDRTNYSTSMILTPVPEPSTLVLAGLGGLGLIGYGLRRRKALSV